MRHLRLLDCGFLGVNTASRGAFLRGPVCRKIQAMATAEGGQALPIAQCVLWGPCTPFRVPVGTITDNTQGIDYDASKRNGGAPGARLTDGGFGSIDAKKLVRDPVVGCAPVYPYNFIRVNTIFGVVHTAGGYTAWSD
jgi:hypothetical protein